ncbi:RNA 2',3'-cyclic phosphodiesterase [Candidatus Wolfebacteria bacterium CG18_big_fil_WC_8_21_14_2_50_39_7]|uniref:RNA 2',3'-cyclic phosphodiesterase n=5 Tax=Candidatus Wolfeibacteriota TaxID=1752735 RepID=A0A2M7Q7H0_9BACT|nr:RNA 2',3'-cyclic phosphodiesterase [Parcubacteria group bacterium]NCO89531.1 RNA 2',3'-cyclic phosphodiesterase [Candidatus Wolfebacteria bacterium]OIO64864.1 MAG: 2'-5' RNA ligase [Candidatus Wolfebacteria bacterium CG1_02_39_135]PIP92291.1 MAG: RNA 2',3'-cyclic phosphodiesterase [Candidatus Wolfebacteria bacterium CG18_big_fil_WC_8_21_14_2_50_39_7]PIU98978.1 MAG: RNA 2',3'-cyclic phosphodiesterase [Candidatus Wolfebacteria bacterium CG03_land_8_20_14_0_80_39_317]PIY59062.1 MAG: RNA 2',3'-
MKRLFIAINLPEEVKRKITGLIKQINPEKFSDKSNFHWLSPENWHLTLVFLGYQPDETISPILESIKETAQHFPMSTIEFEKIILAPPGKTPRMIWLCGTKETSKALGEIKKYLDDSLIKNGVGFQKENRPFNTHLTLARFNFGKSDFSKEIGFPNIENLFFTAESLDLMESHLKRAGAEYETLSKMDFIK